MSTLSSENTAAHQPHHRLDWVKYGLLFTLLWLLLNNGEASSWMIGILVVPVATWCAIALFPRPTVTSETEVGHHQVRHQQTIHLTGLVSFIPFFVWQSLRGGWDIALFAVLPNRRLHQGFIGYTTRLPAGRPQLFFLHVISLLPGTVSADWKGEGLTIHALDTRADNHQALQHCEVKIGSLFDIDLTHTRPESSGGRS